MNGWNRKGRYEGAGSYINYNLFVNNRRNNRRSKDFHWKHYKACFVSIHASLPCNTLRTMGYCSAMISPCTRIHRLAFL